MEYTIGDKVNAVAFTDCFGKDVVAVLGLTVETVTEITSVYGAPTYYRIKAVDGPRMVEGATRFFEHA